MVMVHYFSRVEKKFKITTYLRNAPKINLGFHESREKNYQQIWIASFELRDGVRRSSFVVRRSSSVFFNLGAC